MSCTVVAVPLALSWVAQTIITGTLVTGGVAGMIANAIRENTEEQNELFVIEDSHTDNCDEEIEHSITTSHFIEKEFETPFTDINILEKTLVEHGVQGIEKSDNNISGKVDKYVLNFTKYEGKEAFTLRISCAEGDKTEEKVGDITSEYAMNVQEDVYLHILDKLKENNLQIEDEVVEEDNTIVLTINVD